LVIREKVLHRGSGEALEQAPQGSGHGPKPVAVPEAFRQCSWMHGSTFRLPCVEGDPSLNLKDPSGVSLRPAQMHFAEFSSFQFFP